MTFFQELKKAEDDKIGKKALHLKILEGKGINIPKSFVITTDFQENYHDKISINKELNNIISLIEKEFNGKSVVIRSSATCEDSQFFSFAGQYSSFLDLKERKEIKKAILMCYSSFKSKNAITYSEIHGIDLANERIAILVQEFIPAVKAGILFTINPVNGEDQMLIEFSDGLGAGVVSGEKKPITLIIGPGEQPKEHWINNLCQQSFFIKDVLGFHQDIEWGLINDDIYIFQSRNITTIKNNNHFLEISTGVIGYSGVVSGDVIVVNSEKDLRKVKQHNIVFLKNKKNVFPYLNLLKESKGVIMTGGVLSHIAIILRELKIPFILVDEEVDIKDNDSIVLYLVSKNGIIYKNMNNAKI